MNNEYDENLLFAEVALGIATKEFLNTEVGKLIIGRATEELSKARDDLEMLSESREIGEARIKARAMRFLINWLNEAISNGNQAEAVLTENE